MPSDANTGVKEYTSYIDDLNHQLKQAEKQLKWKEEKEKEARTERDNQQAMVNQLQDCVDRIKATNENAKKVIRLVISYKSLFERASCNAQLSVRVAKFLLVCVEQISKDACELQMQMEWLKQSILTQINPQPNENGAIMKAINDLETAIDTALAKALSAISKALKTLGECWNLSGLVGDDSGNKGLFMNLKNLLQIIKLAKDDPSKIKFPREKCPEDFFDTSMQQLTEAKDKLENPDTGLQQQLDKITHKKLLAKAKRDAIQASKTAAEAASVC